MLWEVWCRMKCGGGGGGGGGGGNVRMKSTYFYARSAQSKLFFLVLFFQKSFPRKGRKIWRKREKGKEGKRENYNIDDKKF